MSTRKKCNVCSVPIRLDEEFVGQPSRKPTRWFHKECYQCLFESPKLREEEVDKEGGSSDQSKSRSDTEVEDNNEYHENIIPGTSRQSDREYIYLNHIKVTPSGKAKPFGECLKCGNVWTAFQKTRGFLHLRMKCRKITDDERRAIDAVYPSENVGVKMQPTKEVMEELYMRHIVLNAVPLEQSSSENLRKMFQLKNVKNFPLNRNRFKEILIPELLSQAEKFFEEKILQCQGTLTLEFDVWTDRKGRSILGCVINAAIPSKISFVHSLSTMANILNL